MMQGCSYTIDLTLTGQILRGADHLPVVGATITLFTGAVDHCSTTTDSEGRWSLTTTLNGDEFWSDGKGRRWLESDPPYPTGAPKSGSPYTIRVETDEGTVKCPIPRISIPENGGNISASMLLLVDASFTLHE